MSTLYTYYKGYVPTLTENSEVMSAQLVGLHSATLPECMSLGSSTLKPRLRGNTATLFLDQILLHIVGDICASAPHPALLSCLGVLRRTPFVQRQQVVVKRGDHTLII